MPTDPPAPAALPLDVAARLIFDHLPVPLCMLDGAQRIVAMNPAAERFWGMPLADVVGTDAAEVLGVRSLQNAPNGPCPLHQALRGTADRVPCRITGRDGLTHTASLVGVRLQQADYAAIGVVAEQAPPTWAFVDPVTGVPNRLAWEEERARWAGLPGAALLFDLDDLKEINDLYGHRTGDAALGVVGQALRAVLPPGASAFRWGGDEFLVLVAASGLDEAQRMGAAVAQHVDEVSGASLPLRPALSFGTATFGPDGMDAGIQRAGARPVRSQGRAPAGGIRGPRGPDP